MQEASAVTTLSTAHGFMQSAYQHPFNESRDDPPSAVDRLLAVGEERDLGTKR